MPPRQRQQEELTETEAIALIAAALAMNATAQATAERLAPRLGIPMSILLPLIGLALSRRLTYRPTPAKAGSAAAESERLEPGLRAAYVLSASQRVARAVREGVPEAQALATERRYFNQHLEAMKNRAAVSLVVDAAASKFGDELGWYSVLDSRTSPECRRANGKNFRASRMPGIGYPGAVHTHCRCKPGKPHRTNQTVYNIKETA